MPFFSEQLHVNDCCNFKGLPCCSFLIFKDRWKTCASAEIDESASLHLYCYANRITSIKLWDDIDSSLHAGLLDYLRDKYGAAKEQSNAIDEVELSGEDMLWNPLNLNILRGFNGLFFTIRVLTGERSNALSGCPLKPSLDWLGNHYYWRFWPLEPILHTQLFK